MRNQIIYDTNCPSVFGDPARETGMQLLKAVFLSVCAVALGGCGMMSVTDKAASFLSSGHQDELMELAKGWSLLDVRVELSSSLSVSEEDIYYPRADIVWREDPPGNRYEQVSQILDNGLSRGLNHLNGPQPVYFDVTVRRFHSLTQKARNSTGGVHRILFELRVKDATTGAILHEDPRVALNIKAFGGNKALEAERRGLTQKVRIEGYLTHEMQLRFGGGTGELPPFLIGVSAPAEAQDATEQAG